MEKYTRKAIFTYLPKFDVLAEDYDYMEVTEWNNGEGFDIELGEGKSTTKFELTWGQYKALKKLVKKL